MTACQIVDTRSSFKTPRKLLPDSDVESEADSEVIDDEDFEESKPGNYQSYMNVEITEEV